MSDHSIAVAALVIVAAVGVGRWTRISPLTSIADGRWTRHAARGGWWP